MAGRNSKKDKKKKRKASDSSANNGGERKSGRYTSTPDGVIVSNILKETNSILFENEGNLDGNTTLNLETLFNSVSESDTDSEVSIKEQAKTEKLTELSKMANKPPSDCPTNADLMTILTKINDRLGSVEKRLCSLESLEKKVSSFEKDLAKLWNCINDQNVKMGERLNVVEEKVESSDYNLGLITSKEERIFSLKINN